MEELFTMRALMTSNYDLLAKKTSIYNQYTVLTVNMFHI